MKDVNQISAFPLQWPDGWVRTRPEQRMNNYSWKHPFGKYRDHVIAELRRLGAYDVVLSTNIPVNKSNGLPREGFIPGDPGVAVYFMRQPAPDSNWWDVLEIDGAVFNQSNTDEARFAIIDRQYRRLAARCHTDGPHPDIALFHQLAKAKESGRNLVLGKKEGVRHVLAADKFDEVRLNFHSVGLTIESLRQIERCGASSMLERAFRGFQPALPAKGVA